MENREEKFIAVYMQAIENFTYLNRKVGEQELKGFKHADVEMVHLIGTLDQPNVTQLSKATHMTRGGVTKMMNKLIDQDLVIDYKNEDNHKERYFKLTPAGQKLFSRHEKLHADIYKRDAPLFEQLSAQEFQKIIDFGETFNQHIATELKKIQS